MISSIGPNQPKTNFKALQIKKNNLQKAGKKLSQSPVVKKSKFAEKISGACTKVKNEYNSWDAETKEYFWKSLALFAVLSVVIGKILSYVIPAVRWFNNLLDNIQ